MILAGIASFIAWGYATNWFPAIRWAGYAFVTGLLTSLLLLLAATLLLSRGPALEQFRKSSRPNGPKFLGRDAWRAEVTALRKRQIYKKQPLYAASPSISTALDDVLDLITRDFIWSWYSKISPNPVFRNEVDKAIRCALENLRDRLFEVDLPEVLTTRLVPLLTAHFRDFNEAERAVRGRKLNRSVTESEELDLAIAAKYKEGKIHPAATLAYSDLKLTQQDYLRQLTTKLLPEILPGNVLNSRAVSTLIREIVSCAVLFPLLQILSDPDTWNQLMENVGRNMLQDRSTVRQLRAALDKHAPSAPKSGKPVSFPRLAPGDSERRFERFVRAIRKVNNLSDARRFRSEVTSQLKKDSQQEGQDPVYLRRLDMGKRLLDQRVQLLAAGGDRHAMTLPPNPAISTPESKLENASLAELLRDASGLSYFMEYMDRLRLMSLVQFWLVVDGFRNPLEEEGHDDNDHLPLTLPPWTPSDRQDLAQIEQAYLTKPELKVPEASKRTVREFLEARKAATPEQYYRARKAILSAQHAVLKEMQLRHFSNFKKSDLWYKCLAAEEASHSNAHPIHSTTVPLEVHSPPPLSRATTAFAGKPGPLSRLTPKINTRLPNRRAESSTDLKSHNNNNSISGLDSLIEPRRSLEHRRSWDHRRSLDEHSPNPLFGDDDGEHDTLADSVASLDTGPRPPDRQVVAAMEEALSNILEDTRPITSEEIRESLFGEDDADSTIFSDDGASKRGSIDVGRPGNGKEPERPSLSSLGLVSAASRIGVFVDDDLFGDEDRYLSDVDEDNGSPSKDDDVLDDIHEAAPGDLGLAEAITVLTNDIDKLEAQNAVVDSLLRKAELTNNMAELRILRKSKASLYREIRRKELQRQQYVVQESDNSLFGRSGIKIKAIQVGHEHDGKEYAIYVIEVSRNAGEKMPAASWIITRRYSEFHDLHQRLRSKYPSVRHLDFPRRKIMIRLQSDFLQKRRQALEKYMRELLQLPDVCRSRELRAFLSQTFINHGGEHSQDQDKKDMMTRLYDSVTDGVEDILGSIPVLDQLSLAGQNLIAAATSQINTLGPDPAVNSSDAVVAAEAEAELNAFEGLQQMEAEPFVKPICDIFLEVFELNRGSNANWLRGRAVVVVLHQLLGGTIERKLRDNIHMLVQEEAVLRYVALLRDSLWPGGGVFGQGKKPRTKMEKSRTRTEASLMLATLVPDMAGSVVGRVNAQAASRRLFATFNNERLK